MTTLATIASTILDETRSPAAVRAALDQFQQLCSDHSGVEPDRSFSAWAEDSFLDSGVAINPQAAAHCVTDYRRSVVFIRALHAALQDALQQFTQRPLQILYAGCGPYATLLLPLLQYFRPGELEIHLLDIHQRSLDSVAQLLAHFQLEAHNISLVHADASDYQHPEALQLIVAETMQKSLEQEPQVAVTTNLAAQLCAGGIFLPQQIDVELGLTEREQALHTPGDYLPLARAFTLRADSAPELASVELVIPAIERLEQHSALLFTSIQVYRQYRLQAYEAEITLPRPCPELMPLRAGARHKLHYRLGSYPGFEFSTL
ncbi:MAG: class I SAM-dependent methyltransferase [Halieaceae bacterium]